MRECLSKGDQVIIGLPFRDFSDAIYAKLEEAEVSAVLLDGDTSPEQRGLLAEEFKQRKHAVLIAGLKAMGEGHSFENCSQLVLPALSFAYDENEQFIHRVWRINSPKPVAIYPIIMEGSIDQNLSSIFREKRDSSDLAIDGELFDEPECERNFDWILSEAIRIFKPGIQSIDEQSLVDQWDITLARQLRHAQQQFAEHHPATRPSAEEMQGAMDNIKTKSPTQFTVDVQRKHLKSKTYKKITASTLKSRIANLKTINKRKK